MNFDILDIKPCALPQTEDETCSVEPGGIGDRYLVLRPESATVPVLGNVQFRTFLVANGMEQEVASGLTYRSANAGLAIVGAIGGNATGVAVGIALISVEWQELKAYAQLQVVESCDATSVATVVVMDVSQSMAQEFGGSFATKLAVGKSIAARYIGELNTTKDTIGIVSFSASANEELAITDDIAALSATLVGLSVDDSQTDIKSGIMLARTMLDDSGADRRVMVVITDGYNNDDSPIQAAQSFRESGGVLIVVVLRAGATAFMLGEKIASGGFFVSAYDQATAEEAHDYVSGLKGYLCAGSCVPDEGFVATGQLNFDAFNNWNVTGKIDLIGKGLYDLLPGHGLYLDMVGSSAPWKGSIQSKLEFAFMPGENYRLSYKLAGNQRADYAGYIVRIEAGSLLSTTREMDNWKQDFTLYQNDFTGDGSNGQLLFNMEVVPGTLAAQSFGVLLDEIKLENLTTGETLFFETFDSENLRYQPPPCGMGSVFGQGDDGGYAYGYDCYGNGCLSEPVKAQAHDPNPPEDIEATVQPSQSWASTQSFTADCPDGKTGASVTRSATYRSFISAADAETRALMEAQTQAEAALVCLSVPASGELLNLDFFANLDGSPISKKVGVAAAGLTDADFWNRATLLNAPLKKSDGTDSLNFLRRMHVYGYTDASPGSSGNDVAFELDPAHPDQMYTRGLYLRRDDGTTPKPVAFGVDNLEPGEYQVFIYGHGVADNHTCFANVRSGNILNAESDPEWNPTGETDYGTGETSDESNFNQTAWAQNVNFLKFNVTVASDQTAILIQFLTSNWSGVVVANGIQILRVS